MGRRGRLPDPNSKKSRAALARARQLGISTSRKPPAPVCSVTPPAHVAARPAAAAFWLAHAATLSADGRLRQVHAELFGQACHLHADVLELQQRIAEEGWLTATDKGQAVSPYARLLRDSRRDLVTLAGRFGLTAADEARIQTDDEDGEEEDGEAAALKKFTG